MAPKSKILKLITVVAFICLFIIILMNIFNSGHSYYYSKVEKRHNRPHHVELERPNDFLEDFWQNNGDQHYNKDLLAGYNNKEPSTEDLIQQFEQQLPNVPFGYSHRHEKLPMEKFKNCAKYPALPVLNFYNNYWQTFIAQNVTFQLYGAYYDEREAVADGPVLRILAMVNQITAPFPTSYCQLWFENDNKPQITAIKTYKAIWLPSWGNFGGLYYPYLMTCDIPKAANITGERIPKAVTIVQHQCDTAGNALKVIYDKPQQKLPFAVCVKGLDFPYADISARLVEWLEMMRSLGASKVYFHHIATHPNVTKVLQYYQQQGFIEMQSLTLVGGVVGLPSMEHWLLKSWQLNKRLNEVMPYNDCFYRNIYKYDYIAVLDIDEVIMPLGKLTTWQGLVDTAKQYGHVQSCHHGYAGICVPNVYFPFNPQQFSTNTTLEADSADSAPAYMFMLNHQYRVKNYLPQGYNTKCLHNTQQTLTVHNHYALSWLKSCKPLDLPNTVGHLQHYHDLKPDAKNKEVILDENIERFREPLMEKCTKVLKDLRLI